MVSVTSLQDKFIKARLGNRDLFGLSKIQADHQSRKTLRSELVGLGFNSTLIEAIIQEAIDMYELQLSAEFHCLEK